MQIKKNSQTYLFYAFISSEYLSNNYIQKIKSLFSLILALILELIISLLA